MENEQASVHHLAELLENVGGKVDEHINHLLSNLTWIQPDEEWLHVTAPAVE